MVDLAGADGNGWEEREEGWEERKRDPAAKISCLGSAHREGLDSVFFQRDL